eukprot:scaffold3619_cov97-Skeletonema_marinoi.AAC.3
MRCLEGFYYRAACRMARENRPQKNRQTGEWTYPARKDVFEEVGLHTLTEYIDRRRKTIGAYISTDRLASWILRVGFSIVIYFYNSKRLGVARTLPENS